MIVLTPTLSDFEAVLDLINEFVVIVGNVADPPDLHLVIVEAPYLAHQRLSETGIPKIVCDLRHDLAHKARIDDRSCDFLPGQPAQRFLYLGETRWLQRFRDLSHKCSLVLRSIDPAIEKIRSEDGIGNLIDRCWIPNFWPSVLLDALQRFNGGTGMVRFRWPDRGYSIVPYDSAEADPAKDVNIAWFDLDIFKVSIIALHGIAECVWENLDPEVRAGWQAEWKKAIGAPSDPSDVEQVNKAAPDEPILQQDLVTLDQVAARVCRNKRTLERYKKKKGPKTQTVLPDPIIEGGGGRSAFYDWKVMRLWLEQEFGMILPENFPRLRKKLTDI